MIKYGELTTKKANRKIFINILTQNVEKILKNEDVEITKDSVRMFIRCNDAHKIASILQKVFGIHGIVIAYKVNNNIEDVLNKSLEIMDKNKHTFKVITKRADKNYPIHSMDYSRKLGGLILKNSNFKVDVHNPDITLTVEIRTEGTFVYTDEIKGAGGYPVGVQGKGLLMLSGGIDSPVAGYLTLKRGVNVECLYLFGTWENLRQALSVLSEKNAKREHLRVVAVIYGQPCGDLSCVDRWFSLSSKTMPAASARAFMRNFERRLNNEQQP